MLRNARCLFTITSPMLRAAVPPPRPLPELREEDIEETFVRGTGPGGQKINKTSVVAQLKHIPTGLIVKCQATRSQAQNRVIARKQLRVKIDDLLSGDQSRSAIKKELVKKKSRSAQKKKNRKYRAITPSENDADNSDTAGSRSEKSDSIAIKSD